MSLGKARKKAKVAATISDFKTIEKALWMALDDEDATEWWALNNTTINSLIADNSKSVKDFLSTAPKSRFGGSPFTYNRYPDGDYCNNTQNNVVAHGPTLWVLVSDLEAKEQIDKIIDDGDGHNCGKIRWYPDNTISAGSIDYRLFYRIQKTKDF